MQIDLVIPFYNNENTIIDVLNEINDEVKPLVAEEPALIFQVIIVNDGSRSSPQSLLETCGEFNFSMRLVNLSRNFGQLAAIYAGYASSEGEATIVMSADGQDPAQMIGPLVEAFQKGHGVVIGVRNSNADPIMRRLTSELSLKVIRSVLPQMPSTWFDFSLVSKPARDQILAMKGRHRFTQGDILEVGFQPTQVLYDRRPRFLGKSSYSARKRLENFRNCILETEFFPRLFGRLGTFALLISILYSIWIFISYFVFGGSPVGWSPLMIVCLFSLGLNLFVSSLVMQFTFRIYSTSQEKPLYIIQDSKPIGR